MEAAEREDELAVQRFVSAPAATAAGPVLRPVQRHPLPRNRQFHGDATPNESQVKAAKDHINQELPKIVQQLGVSVADKTPNPAATRLMLTTKICTVKDTPNVGLGPPAASQGATFDLNVRSPYFYQESGEPDKPFIQATLIHESMHCISFEHEGLQNVAFRAAEGNDVLISDLGEHNSLDEAMTEQFSLQIYDVLYPQSEYKTNYWQGLREIGVHSTTEGLKNLTDKARQYKEKNWTGGLADLVVKEGVLTKEQLELLYLKGEGALPDKKLMIDFKSKYGDVLKLWYAQKEKAWKSDLPKGVMLADDWVGALRDELRHAKSLKLTEGEAVDWFLKRSQGPGHDLVSSDDPRSHVYGATKRRHKDDFEILREFYPGSTKGDARVADKAAPPQWKGTHAGRVRGKYNVEGIRAVAVDQSNKLGLKGKYPHIVIPARDSRGDTPFKDYEAAVFSPDLPDISSRSMSEVSPGVEKDAPAQDVVSGKGGGAYEMQGKVVYTLGTEVRTLLHEIGHYKQDLQGTNEATVNYKLLEYHNIVSNENTYSTDAATANLVIRLSYTGKPMVLKQKDWDPSLPDVQGDPPEYVLLRKLATVKELAVLTELEKLMNLAEGTDKVKVYTTRMQWYLKRQLASEYFQSSKFNKF